MDFANFFANNLPLLVILGVILILVIVLVVFVLRQSKAIRAIADTHTGALDAIKALEQKQTMAFEYAKSDLHRMTELSQRSSENFIEKLQGNQIKLGESFQSFQSQLQKDLSGFKDNLVSISAMA